MWSSLTDSQLQRQLAFLKANDHHAGYVLLGTSWFEFDESMLRDRTEGRGRRLGYDELLMALNHLLVASGQPPDVYELALAYRNSLASQFTTLKGAAHSGRGKDKLFYYSVFWLLKERLPELSTAIYTVNNPGGPVYIFNNQLRHSLQVHGVSTQLYYEVVNDRLCIKFYAEIEDSSTKLQIRDSIRRAVRAILDGQYKVIDSGHLGAYMTACQIEHDFSRVTDLETSASVFLGVDRALPAVADQLSS